MRKLHRWVMTVFAVLFVYWSASGLTLAIYDLTDDTQGWSDGGGPGLRPQPGNDKPVLSANNLGKQFTDVAQAARTLAGDQPLTAVELRMTDGGLQAVVEVGGAQARTLVFDMQNQALLSDQPLIAAGPGVMPMGGMASGMSGQTNLHVVLKSWHRGNIVGTWGVGVAMFTGMALVLMIVTGVLMYFSMWRRRVAAGRTGFWWS